MFPIFTNHYIYMCYIFSKIAEVENLSLRHYVQTDSGAHLATYSMVPGALSLGDKAAEA